MYTKAKVYFFTLIFYFEIDGENTYVRKILYTLAQLLIYFKRYFTQYTDTSHLGLKYDVLCYIHM